MATLTKFVFCLALCLMLAQSGRAQSGTAVYSIALTLNGHPLNYDTFWVSTRGVLAVVEGNPASRSHKSLPFRVYLRRAGATIRQGASNQTRDVYSVQLDELLPTARFGDELIIESAQPASQQPVRRVIKLREFNWITEWLTRRDGC